MSLSPRRDPAKGDDARRPQELQTPGMDAQAQAPAQHDTARSADPALALLSQVNRISVALGNVRMMLAGLDLPDELRTFIYDDQANIAEQLQAADQELAGFLMNLRDDLVGVSTLDTPTRRRVHLPPRQMLEALRTDLFDLTADTRTLNGTTFEAHRDEYMEVIEQLEGAGIALSELKEALDADSEDDAEGGQQ